MDNYEFKLSNEEIINRISRGEYKEAAEIADTIDWSKVKTTRTLCRISDLYKINKRYEDARRVLLQAYERTPRNRKIIFSLCELDLKLNNYVNALQMYNEFIRIAPEDSDRYVLQYKIIKAQHTGLQDQIGALEELARHDYREKWALELAKLYPDINFIGVDIKGARMWTGATQALKEGLKNVAFLRTNIEIIDRFFAADEVQEIWLTFSDPQMKNPRKRLTSTFFMERYRRFLADGGIIHLKTDSNFLFTYTSFMVEKNQLPLLFRTEDLYHTQGLDPDTQKILSIQTYYESMWIERGLNIKYMKFALPHKGMLEEPDVEIPLDDYRSYRRDKRSSKTTAK